MKPAVKKKTAAAMASQFEKTRGAKKESPTPETRMTPIRMCLTSVGLNLNADLVKRTDGAVYARISGGVMVLNRDCL